MLNKLKVKKAVQKRFKIKKSKIMHMPSGHNHNLKTRTTRKKQGLTSKRVLSGKNVIRQLGQY